MANSDYTKFNKLGKNDVNPRLELPSEHESTFAAELAELQDWVKTTGMNVLHDAADMATDNGDIAAEGIFKPLIFEYNQRLAMIKENMAADRAESEFAEAKSEVFSSVAAGAGEPGEGKGTGTDTGMDTDTDTNTNTNTETNELNGSELPEDVAEFCRNYAVDRRHTNSRKWDGMIPDYGTNELLPLWVADMDFIFMPEMAKYLATQIGSTALGYPEVPESYYLAVGNWMKTHYGYYPWQEWYLFCPGVVSGLNWVLQAWSEAGDKILFFSPVYPPIRKAAQAASRLAVDFPLDCQANGRFTIDFVKLEKVIKTEKPKIMVICSPHNPLGRVWTQDELAELLNLAVKYHILVVADEIHQDITWDEPKQTSILALADGRYRDRVAVLHSVSKTFNLAGLAHANLLIPNAELRKKVEDFREMVCHGGINTLSLAAMEFAYKNGEEWLLNVKKVVQYNYSSVLAWQKKWKKIVIAPLEGTYLIFMNLGAYLSFPVDDLPRHLVEECGLAVKYGGEFGENYAEWIRLNLATIPENIRKALQKLEFILVDTENKLTDKPRK